MGQLWSLEILEIVLSRNTVETWIELGILIFCVPIPKSPDKNKK